ncbi:hypothetical protein KSK37_04395 [Kaistella sp. DKR-2]|uniref:hypothetical protein n=1 Tax=Kaistella soli TaxID=2849654 RepID=UPI001C274165|nr:hypothetical protein [Kaistella soli]MBU8882320.1 hypothetical protein [Kaistella soli]
METTENITPKAFMKFFRDTEKLNELTPEDRTEIFRTVLLGSSEIRKKFTPQHQKTACEMQAV